jgi:hypothetical protein
MSSVLRKTVGVCPKSLLDRALGVLVDLLGELLAGVEEESEWW